MNRARVLTAHLGSLVVTVLVGFAGCKDVPRERPGDAAAAETGDALADAGDAAVGRDCTGSAGMGSDCDRMSGQVCYQGHCEYVCDVFGIVGGTLCNQWASGGGTVECCRPDEQCCGYSVDMWTCCAPLWSDGGVGDAGLPDGATD
jgi:hypothetical protein